MNIHENYRFKKLAEHTRQDVIKQSLKSMGELITELKENNELALFDELIWGPIR